MRIRRGLCLGCGYAATEHARRASRGPAPAHDSVRWKHWLDGSHGSRGLRGAASSGRCADSGGRGGPRGGAPVNRGRGGEFNGAGWVPRLELPKQLFVGSAQSLLLLGFFLDIFLEISIFLRQLSAWGEQDTVR